MEREIIEEPVIKSKKRVIRRMTREEYKNLPIEEQLRNQRRKLFTVAWKNYHDKYKQPGNEFQRIFLNAFYGVENGVELCEIKGVAELVKKINTKNPKASAYLSFISEEELDYLVKGLEMITNEIDNGYKNGKDRFAILTKVYEKGLNMRNEFASKNHILPEDVPSYDVSSYIVFKEESKNTTFTSKPKEKVKNAEVRPSSTKANDANKKADDKQQRKLADFGIEM